MIKDLVSIIIPVYNVENYIVECLKSVERQTYSQIEVVIVDDGSTDSSAQICDEFATKDRRFKVIHTPNNGVAAARNVGLENASGEYLFFLDSDDLLEYFSIEKLMDLMSRYQADMVCGTEIYVDENNTPILRENNGDIKVMDKDEALKYFVKREWGPWNKLMRGAVHEGIQFPGYKIHEDEAIKFRLLERCRTVVQAGEETYRYRQRKGSITSVENKTLKPDMFYSRLESYRWLELNHPHLAGDFLGKVCEDALYNMGIICQQKEKNKLLNDIVDFFTQYRFKILKNINSCTVSQKARAILICAADWNRWDNIYIKAYSMLGKM